jgi:hypothetical protein
MALVLELGKLTRLNNEYHVSRRNRYWSKNMMFYAATSNREQAFVSELWCEKKYVKI